MAAERLIDKAHVMPKCPICAAVCDTLFVVAGDRLFGLAAGTFRLHRCPSCGCIFQHPLPDPAAIASFYPREYWWSGVPQAGPAGVIHRMERAYREFVALDHVRFLERCGAGSGGRALLDIGCGGGLFLHLARKRGYSAHGMDASAQAVAVAQAQYDLPVRQGEIGSPVWEGARFDFITMFHVLEHLIDPGMALAYARELLLPGGSLILQVPNVASYQARLFGARWYGLDVPRHLINFTPQSLALLLDRAGFKYQLVRKFSLRDNPASMASSLAIGLDPIGRRARGRRAGAIVKGALEIGYLGLTLAAFVPAWIESACGHGATIWVHARRAGC
jgi:2-polyprenyl-3-methyl-5-hydroxy-6-metoxy-1,4-benzoquinol methylase